MTALLAPPAPNTTDVPFFGFQLGYLHRMLFRKPKASVLSAYISFSFVNIKVFAAPMYLAILELSSAILRADTL